MKHTKEEKMARWIEGVLADVARRESAALEQTEELQTITTLFGCDYSIGESGTFVGSTSTQASAANALAEAVVAHATIFDNCPDWRATWEEEERNKREEFKRTRELARIRDEARYQRWLERMKKKYDI